MSLLNSEEIKKMKLKSIPLEGLQKLCDTAGLDNKGNSTEIIKRLINNRNITDDVIDGFIKKQYKILISERQKLISDDDLIKELKKVKNYSWNIVQGQLDQKIQEEYTRKFFNYDELLANVKKKLYDDITSYVICTWYNHLTTVLIEEHIAQHPKVVPALKKIKGLDIFFDGQPFDLKITYLPKEYSLSDAINNPKKLARWMYEHQGSQRFGADNRLLVVLANKNNIEDSWKLKRDFQTIFKEIDKFLTSSLVTKNDEVAFSFNGKSYKTLAKVLLITKT